MSSPPSPLTSFFHRWWRHALLWVLLFLTAGAFSAWNVSLSRKEGRLSTVVTYDDAAYLNVASEYYFDSRREGRFKTLGAFLKDYTHSPPIVLLAIVGFLTFGSGYSGPYLALTLVVLAYLGFVALICRRLPWIPFAAVLLASLAIPFATVAALEFRPDQLWAIFLTGSCVWILTEKQVFKSWFPSVAFGWMMGMALLSKPSTFAMTFVACGGSWFLAACIAFFARKESFRRLAIGLGLTVAAVLLTAGWYIIPHAEAIYEYFYIHSFGQYKEVWVFKGTLGERMLYYLSGTPVQSSLGKFFLPLVLLFFGGVIRDIARPQEFAERLRGFAFLWMLLCLYLVNSLFTLKSPYLGGAFYGFLIFGGLWNLSRLIQWYWHVNQERDFSLQRKFQGLALVVVLMFATSAYRFPELCKVPRDKAREGRVLNRALVSDILPKDKSVTVNLVLTQGNPIMDPYIAMEFRRRRSTVAISNVMMGSEFAGFEEAAKTADYVVVQDPKLPGTQGYAIPSEKLLPQFLEFLQTTPGWSLVREYPVEGGKKVYLFKQDREQTKATL